LWELWGTDSGVCCGNYREPIGAVCCGNCREQIGGVCCGNTVFSVKVLGTLNLISTGIECVKGERVVLYCGLCDCGECGCNYECQCDCCCNMKHADTKLFEPC